MATVRLETKQEYKKVIANMEMWWVGDTVTAEERYEALSWLANMVWSFHRSLYGKCSIPDDDAAFQEDLYENIDPKTSKAIIAATHSHNLSMNDNRISANRLPKHF